MNLKDLFPQVRGPIPKIEEIDELIIQLQNLKNYFVENKKIQTYNEYMYSQMKGVFTTGSNIPKSVINISNNLRNILEDNLPQ